MSREFAMDWDNSYYIFIHFNLQWHKLWVYEALRLIFYGKDYSQRRVESII